MSHNRPLYHKVLHQLCQWVPGEHISRKRNLALLVMGVYLAASVHLSRIVSTWPVAGKEPSLSNRLRRFLSNQFVQVAMYFQPLAQQLIEAFASHPLQLVMDTTQVGFDYRALVVGIAYRRRTLPLAWSLHQGTKGNVEANDHIALLEQVYRLLPYDVAVHLAADSGFANSDLLRWLHEHEWHFVIRERGCITIQPAAGGPWQRIADIPLEPGQTKEVGWVWRAKTNPCGPLYLLLHWENGEDEPWFLLSDHPDKCYILRTYKRRMWMEAMFGDMKDNGFDLEATQLRDASRIQRLMLGVCIAYVWLVALASWVIKNGYRHLIDRKDRRDKSYFRLGWDWLRRCFRLGLPPPPLQFIPYL